MTREGRPKRPAHDDHALWGEITRSVRPLKGKRPSVAGPVRTTARPASRPASASALVVPAAAPSAPPLAPIDRRLRQRLSRGAAAVDARLDLHGLTQAAAKGRLESFLHGAQARGHGLVLVITGKGRGEGEGVLRRQVPLWLALPQLRALVIGFEEAAPTHGGAGALYVRVRKARD
jgi:DNA-nicking Smr family endonuclease